MLYWFEYHYYYYYYKFSYSFIIFIKPKQNFLCDNFTLRHVPPTQQFQFSKFIDFSRQSRFHARWWTIMNDIVAEAMEQGISKQRSNRRCHVRSVIRIALHLTPRNANNCRSTANKRLTQWGNQPSAEYFETRVHHGTFRLWSC